MIRLSVAPMMDITDRHFRWVFRQLSRQTLLYTEMITTGALVHGDRRQLLDFDPVERPLALQVGGDDPAALAAVARMAEDWGYDEINLNCGCPSPRVQRGSFGVTLMGRPAHVADCVAAMRAATSLPVTVKHRIGFDERDRYEDMLDFVDHVAAAGCEQVIVHARKAWLDGLSPKDNRTVPPLRHEDVYRLKEERPLLQVATNGGVTTVDEALAHLDHVDSVMVGRAAAGTPMVMVAMARAILGEDIVDVDPYAVIEAALPYTEALEATGQPGKRVTRHLLELTHGRPGARRWRRVLGEVGGSEAIRQLLHDHREAAA